MKSNPTKVLLVEDNPGDARLICELLAEVNPGAHEFQVATRLARGLEHLSNGEYDLVLLDLSLPDSAGLDTFTGLHGAAPQVPIIVLTGYDDEAMALSAVRRGAQDYLVKGEFDGKLLSRAIGYAIERKRAALKLQESEQRFEKAARKNADLYARAQQEIRERARAEEKLRLTQFTVDHIADHVIWIKPDARLIYVNLATCQALGYTHEELLQMTIQNLDVGFRPEAKWLEALNHLQAEGTLAFESRYRRQNGETFPVDIVMNFFEFAGNQLICVISRDITERKQLEEKLHQHAEQLDQALTERTLELTGERIRTHTILDALGEAVFVSDIDRNIQYVNQAATDLTGYTEPELLKQKMRLWRSPRQTSELTERLLDQVHNGRPWRGEVTNQRKDKTFYDSAVTIAPMFDAQNRTSPIGYVSIQRDITALKEAERVKYRFVSNVSHELRTPLSILTLLADNLYTLYDKLDVNKRLQLVVEIRNHTLGLNELVSSVLEISRIDSGEIAYSHSRLDFAGVIKDEVAKLKPLAKRKELNLTFRGEDGLFVKGNSGQLQQVIRNLINNAIKYTPGGGSIQCEFQKLNGTRDASHGWPQSEGLPGGSWAALRVADTGIGISPENLPHIFERFYRVNAEGAIPGAGLGLSIAKELTEIHAGYITVTSKQNEGSVFSIYLPMISE